MNVWWCCHGTQTDQCRGYTAAFSMLFVCWFVFKKTVRLILKGHTGSLMWILVGILLKMAGSMSSGRLVAPIMITWQSKLLIRFTYRPKLRRNILLIIWSFMFRIHIYCIDYGEKLGSKGLQIGVVLKKKIPILIDFRSLGSFCVESADIWDRLQSPPQPWKI